MNDNLSKVLTNFINELGISISYKSVSKELNKHPEYPSLLAVSDVLNWFKISNDAYRVNANDIEDVQTPFIAFTDNFVVVKKIKNNKVVLADEKSSSYKLSLAEFKQKYTGVLLTAEPPTIDRKIFSNNWTDKFSDFKKPGAIGVLFFCFLLLLMGHSSYLLELNWRLIILTVIKSAGLILSIILLIQSIDKNNPFIKRLCEKNEGESNCNAILNSKAANVFPGLTWSDVGFYYFAGTWLIMIFAGNTVFQYLAILNVFCLPYTFYSIIYQARIAKQWCIMCCTIQALLWLEFLTISPFLFEKLSYLSFPIITILLVCFLVPIGLWTLLKPVFIDYQECEILKVELRKFKYNSNLFIKNLTERPKIVTPPEDCSIILGNKKSTTLITIVSNPYCPPCIETHHELKEWLKHSEDIQFRIVFTGHEDLKNVKAPAINRFMALNEQSDKETTISALHDWYEQKHINYVAWATKYPVEVTENTLVTIEKQKAWCEVADIKATPAIFVNGYLLQKEYHLQDIKYLLTQ